MCRWPILKFTSCVWPKTFQYIWIRIKCWVLKLFSWIQKKTNINASVWISENHCGWAGMCFFLFSWRNKQKVENRARKKWCHTDLYKVPASAVLLLEQMRQPPPRALVPAKLNQANLIFFRAVFNVVAYFGHMCRSH